MRPRKELPRQHGAKYLRVAVISRIRTVQVWEREKNINLSKLEKMFEEGHKLEIEIINYAA